MYATITEQAFWKAIAKAHSYAPIVLQANDTRHQLIIGWDVFDGPVKTPLVVKVYSSIFGPRGAGVSNPKGTDSIRVCVVDTSTSTGVGKQAYVQRTTGWDRRLEERIVTAFGQAQNELRFRRTTKIPPAPTCPRCGSKMALRTVRATGAHFWGCTSFPACRKTLAFVAPQDEPTDRTFRQLAALRRQLAEWNP